MYKLRVEQKWLYTTPLQEMQFLLCNKLKRTHHNMRIFLSSFDAIVTIPLTTQISKVAVYCLLKL